MRFCPKCQIETERYASGGCKPCAAARSKAWQAANPDRAAARKKEWYEANREHVTALNKAWYADNREMVLVRGAAYYISNTEMVLAKNSTWSKANPAKRRMYCMAWSKANPEKEAASSRKWAKENPSKRRAYERTCRARKLNAGGTHTAADIRELFTLQKGKCPVCKVSIKDGYHVDHVMPLSKGGGNDKLNLQLLCPTCNLQKHAQHPVSFMQSRGFLL